MSTSTEVTTRPSSAPAASVVLTVIAIVTAVLLAPVSSAAAAEPLPAGSYEVMVDPGTITVAVDGAGSVAITASDGLTVTLRFDEAGRALDEFTVGTDEADYLVEVDVAQDGTYTSSVRRMQEPASEGTSRDEVVATVARCAPTGMVARAAGWPNHGTLVSLAASGLPFAAEVTDPLSGDVTRVAADFSDLTGAEAFCELVDATVPSAEDVRTSLDEQRQAARSEREAARSEREAAQRAREAQRTARQGAQDADRAARAEERRAAQVARDAARQERAAQRDADRSSEQPSPQGAEDDTGAQDTTAPTATPTEDAGTDGTTATDSGESTATDDTASPADESGNGNGKGPPADAGGKGNGKDR